MNLNQVTLLTTDVLECVSFYRGLGLTLIVDSAPRYARLECPDGGATLSLHHTEQLPGSPGATIYFEIDDVDSTVERLQHMGLTFDHGPVDQPWLWREARLRDPAGNVICLYHAGDNRRHPPWRLRERELTHSLREAMHAPDR